MKNRRVIACPYLAYLYICICIVDTYRYRLHGIRSQEESTKKKEKRRSEGRKGGREMSKASIRQAKEVYMQRRSLVIVPPGRVLRAPLVLALFE